MTRRFSVTARIGIVLGVIATSSAVIGPFFAPYAPDEILGAPFASPSGSHPTRSAR